MKQAGNPSKWILRPDVEVYRLSAREYLLDFGFVSKFSFVIKDDSKTAISRSIFSELMSNRSVDWSSLCRQSKEPDEANDLMQKLMEAGVLIPEPQVYWNMLRLGASTSASTRPKLGLIGRGLPGFLALEALARYRPALASVAADTGSIQSQSHVRFLFPYLQSEDALPAAFAKAFEWPDLRKKHSPEEVIRDSDVVLVACSELVASDLLDINTAMMSTRKPWLLLVAMSDVALIGPLMVPDRTVCFIEVLEYMKGSGLLRGIDGEKIVGVDRNDHLLLTVSYCLAAQAVAIGVHESVRYGTTGESRLLGCAALHDEARGLVGVGRIMRIPGCTACQAIRKSEDPVTLPGNVPLRSGNAQ